MYNLLKFRKTSEADRNRLEEWIQQDPDHKGQTVDFWLPQNDSHVQTYAVQDEHGDIFFVRQENVLRLHIQFAPPNEKKRLARAISEFSHNIILGAKKTGYKQVIFDSVFAPLIRFLEKRGFRSSPSEFVHDLS